MPLFSLTFVPISEMLELACMDIFNLWWVSLKVHIRSVNSGRLNFTTEVIQAK